MFNVCQIILIPSAFGLTDKFNNFFVYTSLYFIFHSIIVTLKLLKLFLIIWINVQINLKWSLLKKILKY